MVYVDSAYIKQGKHRWCHMLADSHEELMAFAKRCQLNPRWIQYEGTYREHFDVTEAKRALALQLGAEEITTQDLGLMLIRRREAQKVAR
jgi:hypothetical protein